MGLNGGLWSSISKPRFPGTLGFHKTSSGVLREIVEYILPFI
jgi:hypothetical protein